MSVFANPNILTTGLVQCMDATNPRSYSGTGTTWYDASGSSNDMYARNSVETTWSSSAQYFTFNGNTNSRQWYRTGLTSIQDSLTIEAWIYPSSTYYGDMIVINQGAFYHVINSSYQISNYWYGKTNPGYHTCGTALTSNTWNQTVSVWDTGTTNITQYYNGVLQTTHSGAAAGTGNNGSGELEFGAEYSTASGRQFSGRIAVIRIYNTPLSSSQIAQNFNALRGRFGI